MDKTKPPPGRSDLQPGTEKALLEAVLASTHEAVYALNREYRIVLFNAAAETYFGVNRDRVLGRNLWDLFPAGRGGEFEHRLTAAMKDGVRSAMASDSALRPGREVELMIAPMANGVTVAVADVTERRAAERALSATAEHYRYTVELNPQVVWTALPDGQLDRVSERWLSWTGDAGLGDSWGRALHPDDLAPTVAAWTHSVTSGEPYDIEHRVRLRTGAYHWIRSRAWPRRADDGAILKWYGITEDIQERKQAEATLLQSEASLRLATEAAEVGTWDLDTVADVLSWSERTRAAFGLSPDEPVSMADFYAGLHPDDLEATSAAFARAIDPAQRATYDVEYRTIGRHDRIVRWVAVKGRALFDSEGRCLRALGTAIDITARKEIETRLRASEANLRELNATLEQRVAERTAERDRTWQNSQDMLCVIGLDGIFRAANPGWTLVLGWRLDEIIGRSYRDFIHPEDIVSSEAALQSAARNAVGTYENRYRCKDGRYRQINWRASAEDDLVYATGRDVTHERQATQRLERSQALIKTVFDTSFQLQFLLDPAGNILDVNNVALAAVEQTRDTVLGRKFWDCPWFSATPAMPGRVGDAVAVARSGETLQMEFEALVAVGWRRYQFSIRPVRDASGEVVAIVPEAVDITDRRAAEAALRQSQKLEAMGQLTGGVAHDFNNLLTPILGGLDMLQRRGSDDARTMRIVAGALQSAERAKTLVQRLLAFARRQPLQPTAVDASALIADIVELVASTVGPQVRVIIRTPGGLPAAVADPNQLEMAILNLAVNARDAMPDGGTLILSADSQDVLPAHHPALTPGQYVRITVADDGVGMDDDTLARAIEPFFSTKGIGQGTGLGLSMVHGLALQLGGALSIESVIDEGTTISLWLPATQSDVSVARAAAASTAAPRFRGRALLVDDEDMVRASTAEMLADLGYDVTDVASAVAALRLIDDGRSFDLIITDHLMPGMTGVQLVGAVRQRRPDLPALIVSGYAEVSGIAVELPRLTKPFRQADLAAALMALSKC